MIKSKGVFFTNSFEETQNLGKEFVASVTRSLLREGDSLLNVVALYGDLGSGKTTFVQGLAEGFGITRRIISPTFIIIRQYKLSSQMSNLASSPKRLWRVGDKSTSQILKLFYHIDLYRIKNDEGIEELGIEEIIKDSQNIVAIEWAEKMGDLLPKERWDVRFEYVGEDKRRITIKNGRN